jgi:hypothetical protein
MIGFIYIMSNPLHPDDLKIGQSSKDPNERRKELETTGVLEEFVLEYRALSEEYESLEREIHKSLADVRVSPKKEFFTISVPEAIDKIREIAGSRIESDKSYYVSTEELEEIAKKKREKQEQLEKEKEERRIKYEAERNERIKKIEEEKRKEKEKKLKEEKRRKKLDINRDKQRLKRAKEKQEEEKEEERKQTRNFKTLIFGIVLLGVIVFILAALSNDLPFQ